MRVMDQKDKERLAALFNAAGSLLGAQMPEDAIDGVFRVETSDGRTVEVVVSYDVRNACFNLCAPVDAVTGADANVCHALLERNYLFAQTEGAAFAVAPDDAVVLQRDVPAADLEPAALAAAVRSVAGQVADVERLDEQTTEER